jgi:hypothetical protein
MTPLSIGLGDLATTFVNGVSYGMILVLVALGLSLVFGLMGVLNFAHGALFMLGGYVGLAVMKLAGGGLSGFALALVVAPIVVAVMGAGLEKTVFKPLYETEPIYQLLLTFGLAVVIEEAVKYIWGAAPPNVPSRPPVFDGAVTLAGISLPYYRLFTILLGVAVVAGTALFLSRTRYGLIVRAGVYNTDRTATLESRLADLEAERERLEAARANDSLSTGAYRSRMAKLTVEIASLERSIERTNGHAAEVGVAQDRLAELRGNAAEARRNASERGGPGLRGVARGLVNGGGPPDDAGPPGDRGGSNGPGADPGKGAPGNGSDNGGPDGKSAANGSAGTGPGDQSAGNGSNGKASGTTPSTSGSGATTDDSGSD